jgi:hypothetical protein
MASAQGIRAGRAFVELFADDSKLVRALRRAEKKLKAFGAQVRAIGLKVAAMGAAVVAPLVAATKLFTGYGDGVAKMAKRTGLSVEALSELQYAAGQSGVTVEELENSFRRMQRTIYDAQRGLSTAVDALSDLGLTADQLAGLSPEDQFKLLADRISAIEDPTRKAAIAMTILGRSGTQLLPMFEDGAAGIEALQEEARALGLTMTGEDARAAEVLGDAFDRLIKVLKMAAFHVGAALAPALEEIAGTLTRVAVAISRWISQNRQVIVTIARVAVGVIVAGAALVVLGTLISGVGSAIGVLISIVTGVTATLGALAGAIAFLVTPIGAVIAGVAALGAYLIATTDAAGAALDWLGLRFGELRDTAIKAYQGIADALAAGDIALAAQVLWLSLKLVWVQGVNELSSLWLSFTHLIQTALAGAFTGALAALEIVWHGLEVAWIETTSFLSTAWQGFVNIFLRSWARMKALAEKTWNYIRGFFADIDVSAANAAVDAALEKKLAEIDADTGGAVIGIDLQRQNKRQSAATIHEQTMGVLGRGFDDKLKQQEQERLAAERDAEAALLDARKEWEQAIADAREKRAAADADAANRPAMPTAPEPPDLDDLGDLLTSAAEKIGVVGTFNAAAIQGLISGGGGDAAERTATAAEETARNTRRIQREMQYGGLAFA